MPGKKHKSTSTPYLKTLSGVIRNCEMPHGTPWSEVTRHINWLEKNYDQTGLIDGIRVGAKELAALDAMRVISLRLGVEDNYGRFFVLKQLKTLIRKEREAKANAQ